MRIAMTADVIVTDAAPKKKAKPVVLDIDRPFCTVHGSPGRVYFQDGEYFNVKGELITAPE